jgi:hypothetical protein
MIGQTLLEMLKALLYFLKYILELSLANFYIESINFSILE